MNSAIQLSNGVFIYLLGLVVIASQSGRFWLGFILAIVPILVGVVGGFAGWRR